MALVPCNFNLVVVHYDAQGNPPATASLQHHGMLYKPTTSSSFQATQGSSIRLQTGLSVMMGSPAQTDLSKCYKIFVLIASLCCLGQLSQA